MHLLRLSLMLFVAILACLPSQAQSDKGEMPRSVMADETKLVLNGEGTRKKFWINLFDGGLYLKEKCNDGMRVTLANEPMAIKLKVTSELVTGKRLEENIRSEFARVTNNQIEPLKARINALLEVFKEDIVIGDIFDLVYIPEKGLEVYKNNSLRTSIRGLDFKQTVFETWFGNDPADAKFKKGMLGSTS
ncbi:chalcone isomerase family protein [Cytophagaceae bacterium ABcell3]|nr:chalcone isomerase family protein [Cytophagaceae bacterium ABcell3]